MMLLLQQLQHSGNWLFRWRSFLPLVLIGILLLAMRYYQYPWHDESLGDYWEVCCLVISYIGLMIRIFTIGHTPERTSGRNTREQIADTLNTSGIYSTVRNPLYLGNFFMVLGIVLCVDIWWLVLIYCLLFWLYYERIILAEEHFLASKFGAEYLDWAAKTPAFIPTFNNYRKATLSFSVRNVLRREYNGFFAVIVMIFVLDTIGSFMVTGEFEIDSWWLILVGIGFIIWLTLRSLKKYTTLLNVEGR